jgi:hypothetical protein
VSDDDDDEEVCVVNGVLFGVRRGETEREAAVRQGVPLDETEPDEP